MFKVLILQKYYGLSDEEAEFQIRDRYNFMRFVGLCPGDGAPDHSMIWLLKEKLGAEGMRSLFAHFDQQLRHEGLIGKEGRIIDASAISKPASSCWDITTFTVKRIWSEVPCGDCREEVFGRAMGGGMC